jgi:FixJ family two-component response regulator
MSTTAAVRVAIIDDDESICRSLGRLVRQAGFRPVSFLSAEDFLRSPERSGLRCLLVDIQLGGMSGIDLRRRLLAEGDTTPVIYATAHDESPTRIEALKTGCAGFFLKTDSGAAIIEALRHAVSQT